MQYNATIYILFYTRTTNNYVYATETNYYRTDLNLFLLQCFINYNEKQNK